MVLAHRDVTPPISVGLFGDWGSGKSFFMSEMRSLISRLSDLSRDRHGRFCEHIVQLEFNAWHYMDSDLWASMAREIFEGLATAIAERENPNLDFERERLRRATRSTKDLIASTTLQVADVQNQLEQTARKLADVERAQASIQDVVQATVKAVLQTPEVERKLRDVASDLQLDEAGRSVEELKAQFDELSSTVLLARALSAGFAKEWRSIAGGLVVVAMVSAILFVILTWFRAQIAATVVQGTFIAGCLSTLIATVVPGTKVVLGRIEAFRNSLNDNVQRGRVAHAREFEIRRRALADEEERLRDQHARYEQELERLSKLSTELGRLDASHQLVDFIRQRDTSSDYRAQLGTIARASQDFSRLSDLMQRAAAARLRKAESRPKEGDEEDAKLPQIDQIVLYIDDLDRCPEERVVDVLQAVHLLLAYPLFVVVVGVDPRWLLHSLEQHSGAFRSSSEHGDGEKSDEWHSTSLNYLEKIFQIPYTLRPMSSEGFSRLVNDLSASSTPSDNSSSLDLSQDDGQDSAWSSPPFGSADIQLDPNPPALDLEDNERAFMLRLHQLIPTPRATKRFVNLYRLIRASISTPHDLRWFLESREFVAVQVLLAIVTGAPAEASEILRALLEYPEHGAWNLIWWEVVDEVITPRLDQPGWRRLERCLRELRADEDVPKTCEGFRKWADDVARYSFYSGRVLLGPRWSNSVPGRG